MIRILNPLRPPSICDGGGPVATVPDDGYSFEDDWDFSWTREMVGSSLDSDSGAVCKLADDAADKVFWDESEDKVCSDEVEAEVGFEK